MATVSVTKITGLSLRYERRKCSYHSIKHSQFCKKKCCYRILVRLPRKCIFTGAWKYILGRCVTLEIILSRGSKNKITYHRKRWLYSVFVCVCLLLSGWQCKFNRISHWWHYNDVIMTTIASQITSLTVVYSTVYSDADQRKHQSSASLAFVWGIHRDRWFPRTKGQLRGKCFHLMTSSWTLLHSSRRQESITWFRGQYLLIMPAMSQGWRHAYTHQTARVHWVKRD